MPPILDDHPAITLRCASIAVEIMPAGASVRSVRIPGIDRSLVAGAADPAVYGAANTAFLGASIGRTANRIAGARFPLDGEEHVLQANHGPNHLHGGPDGFWARRWSVARQDERQALLTLLSPDGDGGYRGEARVSALFSVEDDGILSIDYRGTVDRPGILGLTAHLYFNLSGEASALGHVLDLEADAYLPVDEALIPTGEIRDVGAAAFDFRGGRRLADGPPVLDHCFCLRGGRTAEARPVARLHAPKSGVRVIVETTEPGLQVYDGGQFDGTIIGLDGKAIPSNGAVALEPQAWPNAPNEPGFPSILIVPGETYRHRSVYRFGMDQRR